MVPLIGDIRQRPRHRKKCFYFEHDALIYSNHRLPFEFTGRISSGHGHIRENELRTRREDKSFRQGGDGKAVTVAYRCLKQDL